MIIAWDSTRPTDVDLVLKTDRHGPSYLVDDVGQEIGQRAA